MLWALVVSNHRPPPCKGVLVRPRSLPADTQWSRARRCVPSVLMVDSRTTELMPRGFPSVATEAPRGTGSRAVGLSRPRSSGEVRVLRLPRMVEHVPVSGGSGIGPSTTTPPRNCASRATPSRAFAESRGFVAANGPRVLSANRSTQRQPLYLARHGDQCRRAHSPLPSTR